MNPVTISLPLFPLGVVIFPHARLPLHVFENRYRSMVSTAIRNGTSFGINLLEKNHLHPVGCMVTVQSVTRRHPDGSFDIIVEGGSRYRLLDYQSTETGYLLGNVEVFEDDDDRPDEELVTRALALYNSILSIGFPNDQPDLLAAAGEKESLSFYMAEKAGLDLPGRQRLLEMRSEARRLSSLVSHMQHAIPLLREQEQLQRLIINDGYLPNHSKRS